MERRIAQPIDPLPSIERYLSLLALARPGLGIVRISRNVVRDDLQEGRLAEVLPDFPSVFQTGALPGLWVLCIATIKMRALT